jgi:hypothetical protein
MSFNNAVYARTGNAYERGDPVGYRCDECGGIFQSMWGTTCNGCREKDRRHRELIAALKNRDGARGDNNDREQQ